MPSAKELDALAQQAGAEHADRIVDLIGTFSPIGRDDILAMGLRALDGIIANGVAAVRERTDATEDEAKRFGEMIRGAYAARLAVFLEPVQGRG